MATTTIINETNPQPLLADILEGKSAEWVLLLGELAALLNVTLQELWKQIVRL